MTTIDFPAAGDASSAPVAGPNCRCLIEPTHVPHWELVGDRAVVTDAGRMTEQERIDYVICLHVQLDAPVYVDEAVPA